MKDTKTTCTTKREKFPNDYYNFHKTREEGMRNEKEEEEVEDSV